MWNEICEKIFSQVIEEYNKNNIKYFILRNYEGLPAENKAKDVDIAIEPGKLKTAREILKNAYKENGCDYYYEAEFHRLHCYHGISLENKIAIHIDLLEGYLSKGYEIFSFEEMYSNVVDYHGICVLEDSFDALLILVYKLFGYKKPTLKKEYIEKIYTECMNNKEIFLNKLAEITNENFAEDVVEKILAQNFEYVLGKTDLFTKLLKKYARRKNPAKTFVGTQTFLWGKIKRIVFQYRKHARVIGVVAPDGAGKTTFINNLVNKIEFYYVNNPQDKRCDVRHFRPTILPNLGEVGEKIGAMEQDKNWTIPHRSKPANPISSFFRMSYYMLDYIVGWQKIVRKNVQYDRFTIFDRYSYDFIVDPYRSKIKLPTWLRKIMVSLTPKPKVMFYLDARSEDIHNRKQELPLKEIERQCKEYKKLAGKNKRFVLIDASKNPDYMAEEAIGKLLESFTVKL